MVLSGNLPVTNFPIQHAPIIITTGNSAHSSGAITPDGGGSPSPTGLTPAQVRTAYGVNNILFGSIVGDGSGQTIAIVDAYDDPGFVDSTSPNYATSDLAQFDKILGLPDPPSFTKYNQFGSTTNLPGTDPAGPGTIDWETEESLDVEWAHAMAPMASIDLVESNFPDDSLFTAVATAAGLPGVSAVSMSWGESEFNGEQTYDSTFASIFSTPSGHQGVTFLASTGDAGPTADYPAYSPNVVAVGATDLTLNADNSYNSEVSWPGSGGGTSALEPEPAYQTGDQNTGMRTIPDVSIIGDPRSAVTIYDSYDDTTGTGAWFPIAGTSVSSPVWAGLIAVADQGRVAEGGSTLDGTSQTLPYLYQLPSTDFHDIVSGSNGAVSAGPGYDEMSGIGSPIANLLVPDLAAHDLTPPTLTVSSFRSTLTGFTATFDEPFSLTPLHLYTTAAANLGPADVTVVGAKTGPVRGSLIVGAGDQGITFVKTGGILAPDTYTVTLLGSANGFQTPSGSLLDGNASGTPGTNFTTTFVIPSFDAVPVVSIPDFARGPGQTVNVPATGAGLPLTISDGTGISGISFSLTYNPALLTITGANLGASAPNGSSVSVDTTIPGRAVLIFTSPTALPAGLDTFASLVASVPNTAPYASKEDLVIGDLSANNGTMLIPAVDQDGVHVVAYLGDTTGNGGYSGLDASLIARVVANVDSGFAAFPLADPTILGDIAGRGSLTAQDAAFVAQFVANVPQSRIPALPGVTITKGGPDPLIWLPQNLDAAPGTTLTVPVLFRQTNGSPIGLNSADVAIEFDPSIFAVNGVSLGDVPRGFTLTDSFDNATGEIIASARSSSGPITLMPGTQGSLLLISLTVRPGASLGAAQLNLLSEGRVGSQVLYTSLNDGYLTLTPAPSDSDTDPTDGIVTVTAPSTPQPQPTLPIITVPRIGSSTASPASVGPVLLSPSKVAPAAIDLAIEASHGVGGASTHAALLNNLATPGPADPVPIFLIPWTISQPSSQFPGVDEPLSVVIQKKVTPR